LAYTGLYSDTCLRWRIATVTAIADKRLRLGLTDDTTIEREVGPLLNGPVFKEIRERPELFAQAEAEGGGVVWPNAADLCPDVLIWGGPPPADATARPQRELHGRYNRVVANTFDRITQNPNMLAGRATIRGLRISVAHVVNLVANGMTPTQIVADLPDLEEEDVRQALAYSAALAGDELHTLRA
jgi:uncharacterized protein (DUF433 family)